MPNVRLINRVSEKTIRTLYRKAIPREGELFALETLETPQEGFVWTVYIVNRVVQIEGTQDPRARDLDVIAVVSSYVPAPGADPPDLLLEKLLK